MKPDTWMPLYVGDYLRDTLGLGRGEHGSYLLLIMAYWTNGGPLPDDDATLREISRCPAQEWARTRGLMLRFFKVAGGEWTHKRIDEELGTAQKNRAARSTSGRLGNEVRWGKRIANASPTDRKDIAQPIADGSRTDRAAIDSGVANESQNHPPSPSPSPSPCTSTGTGTVRQSDKASAPKRGGRLSGPQKFVADALQKALGKQWVNDAGKWITRIKQDLQKTARVAGELALAARENRITTTPAQYAEQIWKEFK